VEVGAEIFEERDVDGAGEISEAGERGVAGAGPAVEIGFGGWGEGLGGGSGTG
jgi:hypothetical protein